MSTWMKEAKMAIIVYHLPVLPTQLTHTNGDDEKRRILSTAVKSNLDCERKGIALIAWEKWFSEM